MTTLIRLPRRAFGPPRKSRALLILLGIFYFVIAHASSDHLLINQIQITGGSGKTSNDFVEIFNPTGSDIDLQGYRLVKRSAAGTSDTTIKSWTDPAVVKAGGYYLWANSTFIDIAAPSDVSTTGSLANDNGIALRFGPNDTGAVIDSLAWGNASNIFVEGAVFPTNPGAGEALLRQQDTDNNAADFIIATSHPRNAAANPIIVPDPTPTPEPVPLPDPTLPPPPVPVTPIPEYSHSIIISEFLPNPDGTDSGEEWAELFNSSGVDVNLWGWYLDDEGKEGSVGSSAYKLPDNTIVHGLSYLVIKIPDGSFSLNNSGGDTLRLLWPDKQQADAVAYPDTAKENLAYASKTDHVFAWTSTATPGLPNQFDLPDEPVVPVPEDPKPEPPVVEKPNPQLEVPVGILINELYPEPSDSDTEFIELYNSSDLPVNAYGFKISDKSTSYKIVDTLIDPKSYLVLKKSDTKIALNNTGEEKVTLIDPNGNDYATVSYQDAPKNQSYNLTADGNYVWSEHVTPGAENIIFIAPSKPLGSVKKVISKSNLAPEQKIQASAFEKANSVGEVASAIVTAPNLSQSMTLADLWPWLAGSFAVNILFCYSFIRFMIRKGTV